MVNKVNPLNCARARQLSSRTMSTPIPTDTTRPSAPPEPTTRTTFDPETDVAPPTTLPQAPVTDIVSDAPPPEGESLIAPTVEPPPHESTKVEITQLKDPEVKDFGWNSKPDAVPTPLIKGLPNEDLYTLIRRFDKVRRLFLLQLRSCVDFEYQQLFHVKSTHELDGLLDLEVSPDEEFSPDKLRATLERLYMTVVRRRSFISRVNA